MGHERILKKLQKLDEVVEALLAKAKQHKSKFEGDAINWATLYCVESSWFIASDGETGYRIHIEECAPDAHRLKAYLRDELPETYGHVEVTTEW